MKEEKAKIEGLQQNFAAIKKQYEESKGYTDQCCEQSKADPMYQMMCYMDGCLSSVYRYISSVESSLYDYMSKHAKGHLPPIQGAGKMETALDKLGISEDYDVAKPVVYASHRGLEMEFAYTKDATKKA